MKILRDAEVAMKANKYAEAEALYVKAASEFGSEEYALAINLGALTLRRRDFSAADAHLCRYRARYGGRPEFENLEANLAKARGDYAKAEAHYRAAIATRPAHASAHYNLALLLMLLGRWQEGWEEHEWRWKTSFVPNPNRLAPLSPEATLRLRETRKITVWPEQGMGDFIHFTGYLRWASKRHEIKIAERSHVRDLIGLFVPDMDKAPGEFARLRDEGHVIVPLMSLPLVVQAWQPVPVPVRSLPKPSRRKGAAYRVAVCWKGNFKHANDADRSLSIERMKALLPRHAEVVAVQLDCTDAERDQLRKFGWTLVEPSSWIETQALLADVDETFSVDTGFAHFAAAHGVPTKLILSEVPDWRWGTHGGHSALYPAMDIIRLRFGTFGYGH
jgi:tetratricopeptide (TPR) repeat protein